MTRFATVFAIAAAMAGGAAGAQTPVDTIGQMDVEKHKAEGPVRDFSPIVVPIPISDPAIGSGLALGALGLFRVGASEKPWAAGVGGLYTDSDSYAALLFGRAQFAKDKYQVMAAGGGGVFNIDFFGIGAAAGERGVSIPIEQKAVGGLAQGLMRVAPHVNVGLQYRYINMDTTVRFTLPQFPDLDIPPLERESATGALGLSGEYDSRDEEFNPGKGLYGTAVWLFADKAFGGDFSYSRAELALNGYHRLDPASVFAWRGSTCIAGDEAPFYDICNFGASRDLRGYSTGQYRDRSMYAVQAEYRRHLFWRLGGVVFTGVGQVAPDYGGFGDTDPLPAAGVGLRLQASKKYKVNISVDYGWGKDSHGLYVYVGEAF